jgi:hypothetical protein
MHRDAVESSRYFVMYEVAFPLLWSYRDYSRTVRHQLLHQVRYLRGVTVHVDPG